MNPQPKALVLADALEELDVQFSHTGLCGEAADELRRLHEENERLKTAAPDLLEVLKAFSDYVRDEQMATDGAVTYSTTTINHWAFLARAAIAKARGEQ
jgi:hypothetical protein